MYPSKIGTYFIAASKELYYAMRLHASSHDIPRHEPWTELRRHEMHDLSKIRESRECSRQHKVQLDANLNIRNLDSERFSSIQQSKFYLMEN